MFPTVSIAIDRRWGVTSANGSHGRGGSCGRALLAVPSGWQRLKGFGGDACVSLAAAIACVREHGQCSVATHICNVTLGAELLGLMVPRLRRVSGMAARAAATPAHARHSRSQ